MGVRSVCATLGLSALSSATPAHADFQTALGEYNAGHYEVAHAQFLALAELGDCSSQFNLGAMALQGQGGPKDAGSGVGWLQAAAGNGCERLVGNRLTVLAARLTADEARTAAVIVEHYGQQALRAQGVIDPDFNCAGITPPRVVTHPEPEYPPQLLARRQDALIITALTIGADGRARDPEVLLAVPQQEYAAAAIEAWLNASFAPALRNGQPVEYRLQAKQVFATEGGGSLAVLEPLQRAHAAAEAGDSQGQYVFGLAATLDNSLGVSSTSAGAMLMSAARAGGAQAQYWIGSQLRATASCHPHADGTIWLQHAAAGGNGAAEMLLATELLRDTPAAAQIAQARAALAQAAQSEDYYVRKHVVALLAASRVDAVRDPHTAVALAQQLLHGDVQSDPHMFVAVAAAYASSGDFHAAVAQQQRALQKALTLGWDTHTLTTQLAAYRAGRPWLGDLFASP